MSYLDQVTQGVSQEGLRIVIAAQEKVGKTTLAAGAPNALLIPLEIGYGGVNVSKAPMIQSWENFIGLMNEICQRAQAGQLPYQTLIFDSVTALEAQIHHAVLMRDPAYAKGNKKAVTMESALGGYGKAYSHSNELFREFLNMCDWLATHCRINIVLTAHVFASKMIDPTEGEFDSWDILLHSPKNNKTYGKREMLTQWADMVCFLHEPIYITKTESVSKGISANKGRVLGVSRTPSYVAGNRFGLEGEISIPKIGGWNVMAKALYDVSGIDIYNHQQQ